jgi:hypothetical protein
VENHDAKHHSEELVENHDVKEGNMSKNRIREDAEKEQRISKKS